MTNIIHSENRLKSSNRETEAPSSIFGLIKISQIGLYVSQAQWDLTFHKPEDCQGNKRPEGCLVCKHDTESCKIKHCAFCQKKQGLPLTNDTDWQNPLD